MDETLYGSQNFIFVLHSVCRPTRWLSQIQNCPTPANGPSADLRVAGGLGAEAFGIWDDAHAGEIQTVCIPAGANGDVRARQAACVFCASIDQLFELSIVQVNERGTDGASKISGPLPMVGIATVIESLDVVEESEILYHRDVGTADPGEVQAILPHTLPVGDAMDAVPGQGLCFPQGLDEFRCDDLRYDCVHSIS